MLLGVKGPVGATGDTGATGATGPDQPADDDCDVIGMTTLDTTVFYKLLLTNLNAFHNFWHTLSRRNCV